MQLKSVMLMFFHVKIFSYNNITQKIFYKLFWQKKVVLPILKIKQIVVGYSQKDQHLHYILQIFQLDQVTFFILLLYLNNHRFQKLENNMLQITSHMLKNIFRGSQDILHLQILGMIDIIKDLVFLQQSNFHQKEKKLNIQKQLQSQMPNLILQLLQILIQVILILFQVIREQLTHQDQ
ncbi:unnamed protein product [Paramecium sonneborni]|uniref:Uncharacterized protein n=1 Tax=Paramecium sonneborni TaxID=65129 RepID=A0A8S1M681_9CILI|nr:unnamed protein product [Paramecium sonneborni]